MSNSRLRFHIQLDHIKPDIWRRFEVPVGLSFADLHLAIQGAMGWENSHLHQFFIGDTIIGRKFEEDFFPGEEAILDHEKEQVEDYLKETGQELRYLYDFGDSWEHTLTFEGLVESETQGYQVVEGARACPPENCGGIPGYFHMHEVMKNPSHPDYDHFKMWLSEGAEIQDLNPEAFSIPEAQNHLDSLFREAAISPSNIAGFSIAQLQALLERPFESGSPLELNPSLSEEALATSPLFQLALALMKMIEESGGLKATAKLGNLPRKAVQELYGLGWLKYSMVEAGHTKISSEADFSALHGMRLCLEIAKLIRKYKGKFVLTKLGSSFLTPEKHSDLFRLLCETHATRFNLAYFDGYADERYAQWGFAFSLLMLKSYGAEPHSADWYHRHYWPMYVTLMGEPKKAQFSFEYDPVQWASRCYQTRFLDRYAKVWGLVTFSDNRELPVDSQQNEIQATPLLQAWITDGLPEADEWRKVVGMFWGE